MIRRRYRFYGLVQGVGFRYTAVTIAGRMGLTGWVRNLNDGSVEMEAQGSAPALEHMIEELSNSRFIRVDSYDVDNLPTSKGERDFHVTY